MAAAARFFARTSSSLRPRRSAGHENYLPACHLMLVLAQPLDRPLQREARANLRLQFILQEFLNPARHEKLPEHALPTHPVGEPEAADALPLEDERARVEEAALLRERAVDYTGAACVHRAQNS